jgi:hypothetical protein
MDVSGYEPTNLRVFDSNNATIFDESIVLTGNVAAGHNYAFTSATGIGGFEFTSGIARGSTAIDNVVVVVDGQSVVPEPVSMLLLGTGLAGVAMVRRRRRQA